jgi:hypothetical protein
MNKKTNSIIVSASIGITAYMFTDIIHEVIGHSIAALFVGSKIILLTSAFFKSNPGSIITDLGGPFSNLLFGLFFFAFLKFKSTRSFLSSLLLTTTMAYNFFWFSGTILQSSYSKTGDWVYAVAQLEIGTFAKPLLIIIGIIAYLLSFKLVVNRFSNLKFRFSEITLRQSTYYAYFFGILGAMVAGLFFASNEIAASREGIMEMVASFPILFINRIENENKIQTTLKINWIFYFFVCVAYILFCLTLGKGIY